MIPVAEQSVERRRLWAGGHAAQLKELDRPCQHCQPEAASPDAGVQNPPAPPETTDLEVFKLACAHFRGDIAAHWTQASFFALIQAAFISFFASEVGPQDVGKTTSLISARAAATLMAVAGGVFALLWFVIAFGREKYIRAWRKAVMHLDEVVDRHRVYLAIEVRADGDRFNPTIITTLVPAVIGLGWLAAGILLWVR